MGKKGCFTSDLATTKILSFQNEYNIKENYQKRFSKNRKNNISHQSAVYSIIQQGKI